MTTRQTLAREPSSFLSRLCKDDEKLCSEKVSSFLSRATVAKRMCLHAKLRTKQELI